MVEARIGDDLIISQIRNSRTVYHLTTADIIDLKKAHVSEKVIDFMINTPALNSAGATVPPTGAAGRTGYRGPGSRLLLDWRGLGLVEDAGDVEDHRARS